MALAVMDAISVPIQYPIALRQSGFPVVVVIHHAAVNVNVVDL